LLEKIIAVKKPASGLPQSLLAQYSALGAAGAFRVEPLEKGLLFLGKTVKVALKVEFGNRWEFFNTITALRETEADIRVLVTSSNVKSITMETIYTVLKKKLGEKSRWALIDIEGKKEPMLLNFSQVRSAGAAPERAVPGKREAGAEKKARPEPEMKKTKNYGLQPRSARPRRKKIYGKRVKKQD
jgi:hypothetical protein